MQPLYQGGQAFAFPSAAPTVCRVPTQPYAVQQTGGSGVARSCYQYDACPNTQRLLYNAEGGYGCMGTNVQGGQAFVFPKVGRTVCKVRGGSRKQRNKARRRRR